MYQKICEFINTLDEKQLKDLYEKYYDMAFTFYIDSDKERYNKTMNIVYLIEDRLREKGYWNKK